MKINFVDKIPDGKNVHYCHFLHQNLNIPNTIYVDLKALAKLHEKIFFHEVEKWHSNINLLGLKQTDHWWLTQCSRLMSWEPSFFTPLFFHYLLKIYLTENKVNEIYVVAAPKEVIELAPDFYSKISLNMNQPKTLIETKNLFNNHFKPYLSYLKNFVAGKTKQKKLEKRPYLIHTSLLNPENLLKGLDHYFGPIFFELPLLKRQEITWLFHYPQNDPAIKNKVSDYLYKLGFQALFTYDSFSFSEISGLIIQSIKIKMAIRSIIHKIHPIKIKDTDCPRFTKLYAEKCLKQKQDSLSELELYESLIKHLEEISPEKIIFAYEERSIERAILIANNKQNKPAISYGFVHSVMHNGHICFDLKTLSEANPPRPDKILVTGIAARDWFKSKGYDDQTQLKIIGSPRCVLNFKPISKKSFPIKLLFLVGQGHELTELSMMLKVRPEILEGFDLTIRKYPYGWFEDQNKGLELLKNIYPNLKDGSGNFKDQLDAHDIILFSTSSAGIEAIMNGKLGININLDQFHSINPIEIAKGIKSILCCQNIEQLEKVLTNVKNLSIEQWNELVKNQMLDLQLIYEPFKVNIFLD